MTGIRFSVVIPTYNRVRLVGRAVNCVLEQTRTCEEILVVDDGSSDGTHDAVRSMGGKVRLILQEHGGPSRARNTGVREAVAEWIAFLDSDDLWQKDHLERMAAAIEQTGGEAALYFADAEYRTGQDRRSHWSASGFTPRSDVDLIRDAVPLVMCPVPPMLMPFCVIRKDVYLRYGGLWEELWSAEDTHLFIRLGLHEAFCAVAGSGGIVTADELDPGNRLTIAYDTGTIRRWNAMVRLYTDLLKTETGLAAEIRKEFQSRLAHCHWRLARLQSKEGKMLTAVRSCWTSLRLDPAVAPGLVISGFRRRITGR